MVQAPSAAVLDRLRELIRQAEVAKGAVTEDGITQVEVAQVQAVVDTVADVEVAQVETVVVEVAQGAAAKIETSENTEAEVEAARAIALRQLVTRARSRAELENDLRRRAIRPAVVAEVLSRLQALGLIDDLDFARQWIEQRRRAKGLGMARLRQELLAKGIAEEIVAQALSPQADPSDDEYLGGEEEMVALEWARRRARHLGDCDLTTRQRRLAGQLTRRGFSASIVRRVVFQIIDETPDQPPGL